MDLEALSQALKRPCVAVMRRPPDLPSLRLALQRLPRLDARWARFERAGPIYQEGGFVFQVRGAAPDAVAAALARVTDTGKVPEALRLAHLVGAAIVTGQSGRRA